MKYVKPGRTKGLLKVIGSKSVMQRAVACALLSNGETTLVSPSLCDDGLAALSIIQALGAEVQSSNDIVQIKSKGLSNNVRSNTISVGESGLSIRLFSSVVSMFSGDFTLNANGSLLARPMLQIEQTLSKMGCTVKSENGRAPIKISGPLKPGNYTYDGESSSQVLTGLLTSLPLLSDDSTISYETLTSKPYIDLTIEVLKSFGVNIDWNKDKKVFSIKGNQSYKPTKYVIEGDWSGASFFAALGAHSENINLSGLKLNSSQGDKEIIKILKAVGASVVESSDSVKIQQGSKNPFEFDATDAPDLFPPLVALAVFLNGTSRIKGAHRLKGKESDRAEVLVKEFTKLGAKLKHQDDEIIIDGSGSLRGGEASAHGDHRIAMALAIAGILSAEGVSVEGYECVSKSYPNFFEELESLRIV